jgi:sodium-dependent dicarboxylate transporter 2/3/5
MPDKPVFVMNKAKLVLVLLPLLFWVAQEIHPFFVPHPANRGLCLLLTMALWWVTETFPLHWVALIPIVLIPLLPVVQLQAPFAERVAANFQLVALPFIAPFIFLFLGGMMIGIAMEEHNLHRRIALNIIRVIGSNPRRLLLGFVLATAFISLWISNTATAVMMVPIALAVIAQMESREGRRLALFGQSIMLAIAYGANVGGIGTLIGTAPNLIFAGFVQDRVGTPIDFLKYLTIGLPFVFLMLPVVYAMLAFLCRRESIHTFTRDVIDEELAKLGPMNPKEKIVLAVFALASSLWIFNEPIRSWTGLKDGMKGDAFDGCAALLAGVLLLATNTLTYKSFKRMPWDVLLLLGGSLALAAVVEKSGLSKEIADALKAIVGLPPILVMIIITIATVLLSAFSSNMATTALMLTVVVNAFGPNVALLAGVTIAASCDFMLPAGTPPNAIVFGTRYIRIRTMASAGFALDMAAAVLAALWVYFGASRFI